MELYGWHIGELQVVGLSSAAPTGAHSIGSHVIPLLLQISGYKRERICGEAW